MSAYIDIVFDGPPAPYSGRFIEIENELGQSISTGEWIEDNGQWRLRIKVVPGLNAVASIIHDISTSKGFAAPSMENLPGKLMLSVSELSESMEEHRNGRPLVWYKYSGAMPDGISFTNNGAELYGRGLSHEDLLELGYDAKPEGILVELGDSVIRNLHMMHALIEEERAKNPDTTLSVADVIMEKIRYNDSREAMHGGKKY